MGNLKSQNPGGEPLVQQDLGTKRVCSDCAAKFYDLNKNPTVCPKCGHEEAVTVPRAKRKAPEPVAAAPKEAPAEKPEEEEEGDVAVGTETSLDELAAEEQAASGDDADDDVDDILAIDDDEEDDPFLPDDDEDDDDVSDLIPGVKDDS